MLRLVTIGASNSIELTSLSHHVKIVDVQGWYGGTSRKCYWCIRLFKLSSWQVGTKSTTLPLGCQVKVIQKQHNFYEAAFIQSDPPCYINKSAVFWHLWAKCMAKCRKSSGRLEMCKTIIDHHNVQNHLHAIHDPVVVSQKGNTKSS